MKTKFLSAYDPATGVVHYSTQVVLPLGVDPDKASNRQWRKAIAAIRAACPHPLVEGMAGDTHRVIDGQLVDVAPVPKTIEQLRTEKWQDIKRARAAAVAGGVEVKSIGVVDAHASAITAVLAAQARERATPDNWLWTVDWTLHARSGDAVVTLDREQFALVADEVLHWSAKCHAIGQQLRQQIAKASAEELAAITWPAP